MESKLGGNYSSNKQYLVNGVNRDNGYYTDEYISLCIIDIWQYTNCLTNFQQGASSFIITRLDMNWEINLSLNTTLKQFETWLNQYIHKFWPFSREIEQNKVRLRTGSRIQTHTAEGTIIDVVYGTLFTIDPIDPNKFLTSQEFPILVFEFNESSKNLLEVKLSCKYPGLLIFFLDLLKEIGQLWPEAETDISKYIEEVDVWEDNIPEPIYESKEVFHELDIRPATIKDVLRFITELHIELGEKSKILEQPEGITRWFEFESQVSDNSLVTYAEEFIERENQLPRKIIHTDVFEFICVGIGNKVRIKATCMRNDVKLLTDYFDELWLKFVAFLPSEYKEKQIKDIISQTEPIKKFAHSFRGRKSEFSQEERDETVRKWISKGSDDARTLNVFLVDLFGEKESDPYSFDPTPIYSKSTFYNWRRDYLDRNPEEE